MATTLLFIFANLFLAVGVLNSDTIMYFFFIHSSTLAVGTYCRALDKKSGGRMKQLPAKDISDETLDKVAMMATKQLGGAKAG